MAKPKLSKLPARIFITLLGFAFIVWGLATITLGLIGNNATALITDIRREGGERNEVKRGSYTYNISYTFTLPNGKSVNGFTKTIGNAIYLKADGKSKAPVKYLSFFPYINALERDTNPGLGQLILIAVGFFLIFVMNKRKKTAQK